MVVFEPSRSHATVSQKLLTARHISCGSGRPPSKHLTLSYVRSELRDVLMVVLSTPINRAGAIPVVWYARATFKASFHNGCRQG